MDEMEFVEGESNVHDLMCAYHMTANHFHYNEEEEEEEEDED